MGRDRRERLIRSGKEAVHRGLSTALRRRHTRNFAEAVTGRDEVDVAIGCGPTRLPGFICTDVHWRADHYLDLSKPWPVPGPIVRYVYADNVIEHFTYPGAIEALRHAHDAMKPGGVIRLATPDVERTARTYLDDPEGTQRVLQRHRDNGYTVHQPVDLLRVTFAEAGHHLGYLFDLASLREALEAAGFTDVRRAEAGESEIPELRGLEARATPVEASISLVVEARRP